MVAPGARAWGRLVLRSTPMSIDAAVRAGPWLILAPHPDDESLGAGSLIAGLVAAGGEVSVAFLTDGAGSHQDAPGWSARRVARAREGEARHALRRLGLGGPPLHLGWADANPHRDGLDHARSVRALTAWCRRRGVRAIATTWQGEPHCDHEAAALLAEQVARRLRCRLYDYLVWGWTLADLDTRLRRRRTIAVDVAAGRPHQRRAIACHRSQTGTRIAGARDAFRLPRAMIDLVSRPRVVLLCRSNAYAS